MAHLVDVSARAVAARFGRVGAFAPITVVMEVGGAFAQARLGRVGAASAGGRLVAHGVGAQVGGSLVLQRWRRTAQHDFVEATAVLVSGVIDAGHARRVRLTAAMRRRRRVCASASSPCSELRTAAARIAMLGAVLLALDLRLAREHVAARRVRAAVAVSDAHRDGAIVGHV